MDIHIKEGSHQSENAVNKQLNDKERVAGEFATRITATATATRLKLSIIFYDSAALENNHLLDVVHQCIATAGQRGKLATAA